ncbi:EAL domain-containing protein [Curvibacter sp. HBC61]|uniref:EAL domain-containing protein n=1 Tax=Curvibacter cyanobacteriorum TaxID=3026422 RepID=A0ABT5MVE1_9BURK|nr:GGDEF domain-containing phosphodiesterase [Curvibacter sp. HBC61]MDD0837279.1 EAL domain-containing protein [Curvibacter sp. HBC61]
MPDALFPRPMDDDVTLIALVKTAGWTVLVVAFGILLALLAQDDVPWLHVWLHVGAVLLGAVTVWGVARGRVVFAARTVVWGMWVLATLVTVNNGGVRGPNLLNFLVMVVFAGWVLGTRATLALTACTSVLFVGLLWGDTQDLIPPAHFENRVAYGIYLAGILSLTAYMTLMSRRSYLGQLREAQRIAADLAGRERELRKLQLAVEQSPECIVITDLAQRIEYANPALERSLGLSPGEALGRLSGELSTLGLSAQQQGELQQARLQGEGWSGELSRRRRDGQSCVEWLVVAPIRQPDGAVTHWVEIKHDITERRRAAAEIHRLAYFDSLTGLPNRAALLERLQMLSWRDTPPQALLQLNLARFRTFNEARGQEVGDRLLRAVAQRLGQGLPEGGRTYRLGADEFAILLPGQERDETVAAARALAFAERLHAALQEPLSLGEGAAAAEGGASEDSCRVACCLGITLYPQRGDDAPQDGLRRCGTALHDARARGPGHSRFYEPGMAEAAERRFVLERELRQAVAGDELVIYLQSQVNTQGTLCGAEVLVRWQHPQRGLVPPGEFIPVAEESGLIVAVGDWVLLRACQWLARHAPDLPGFRLSVNLSPRQFARPGFVEHLQACLRDTGVNPAQLTLEVTEGVVIGDFEDAVAKMRQLAALGIEFSLDDFGTGYSSLAYLKRLPIHELKIDKSFVQCAPDSPDDASLVDSILLVAERLRLRVVAEGVETQAQADFMGQRLPSVLYQGYWLGRPQPADQWLAGLNPTPRH